MGAMISRQGCLRVQALADGMGLSLRQFERRFTTHLGISPKVYARILRFEAAIHRKSISAISWTSIAHDLGYCDQAHMIHDFQSLSSERPSQLTAYFELLNSMFADYRVRLDSSSHRGIARTTAIGEVGALC